MVAGGVDGGNTIDAFWEALGNIGTQNTVLCNTVEALEESEDLGVQRLIRIERRHLLHRNVTVALNGTTDQLLRGGVISVVRIGERSGDHVVNFEGDGERGICSNGIKVLGGGEFGGRLSVTCQIDSQTSGGEIHHLINGRNITHGNRVARTCPNLFTVRKGLANTGVDEVVPKRC